MRNGAIADTISYLVQPQPKPDVYPLAPTVLVTSDTIRANDLRGAIGKPVLFICEWEMQLDYGNGWGAAFDGSVYTYRRQ